MKAARIFRFLFVVTALALLSCGQTVTPSRPPWSPPPGISFSTLHGIWVADCRFRAVQHLHGTMAPPAFDLRGNLFLQTWLQIRQIGPIEYQFWIGGSVWDGDPSVVFSLTLSAVNGSITGSGPQLVGDSPQESATLVSATGTYTDRTLNLVFLQQIDTHTFDSAFIEQATCTATRFSDW